MANRIYSIVPAEVRPRTMAEKLWSWPVVGTAAPILWAGGVAAMYGGDYKLATALYFVGIGLATAKFLTWEEHKQYSARKKVWLWIVMVIVATVVFGACFHWIQIRRNDVQGPIKEAVSPPSPPVKMGKYEQHFVFETKKAAPRGGEVILVCNRELVYDMEEGSAQYGPGKDSGIELENPQRYYLVFRAREPIFDPQHPIRIMLSANEPFTCDKQISYF